MGWEWEEWERRKGEADLHHSALEVFARMPELPSLNERWTARRKAAVIEAVRGGWVPIEEICRLYNLSIDEFLTWERAIDHRTAAGAFWQSPEAAEEAWLRAEGAPILAV